MHCRFFRRVLALSAVLALALAMGAAGARADYDPKAYAGQTLKLALVKHPWTDAIIAQFEAFTALSGIELKYEVYPEEEFFNKISVVLASGSKEFDIFMIGPYQIWQYAPAGWLEPLDKYLTSPDHTAPDWDLADIYENILKTDAWDLVPGHALGTGEAQQWAMPFAFHLNCLQYRKDLYEKYDLKVPTTLKELIEVGSVIQSGEGDGIYGVSVRGTRSWATIHPGFMTAFVAYGAKDFNADLTPALNSPEAVKMVEDWIEMVKAVGPPQYTSTTWYEVSNSIGNGQAAMIYDADVLGYFQNTPGASPMAGKIAWAPGPGKDGPALKPNIYAWSLSINAKSDIKDAAWRFLEWSTSKPVQEKGALEMDLVNPIRKSTWANPKLIERLSLYDQYYETYQAIIGGANVYYTPQPLFFEMTTLLSEALQKVYLGESGAKEALDAVAAELAKELKEEGILK